MAAGRLKTYSVLTRHHRISTAARRKYCRCLWSCPLAWRQHSVWPQPNVSASCFYRLRQMLWMWRSLDNQSATTLLHALVLTRVDYCNSVLAAAPKTTTDKLQRVLNATARVVSNTCKFDCGLSQLLHDDLHWLDVPDHVTFKLIVTVWTAVHQTICRTMSSQSALLCHGSVFGLLNRTHW